MPIRPENKARTGLRQCSQCPAVFVPYRRDSNCCSARCRKRRDYPKPEEKICKSCSKPFTPAASAKAIFCSERCRAASSRLAGKLSPDRRERIKARQRAYSKTERFRFNQNNAKHRRRQAERDGDFTFEQWQSILAAHDHRCAYCGIDGPLTIDHVRAISRGGKHTAANIVPACQPCNLRKGNREWKGCHANS